MVDALAQTGPAPRSRALAGRQVRTIAGAVVLAVALWWLWRTVDLSAVTTTLGALLQSPLPALASLLGYAAAFLLRSWAWHLLQPVVPLGQAWAAVHVSLAGNHLLPLRLGEVLRVTSAVRRTEATLRETSAVTVSLRLGDLLALLVVAAMAAPVALARVLRPELAVLAGVVLLAGVVAAWVLLRPAGQTRQPRPTTVALVVVATVSAWLLEAAVLFAVATTAGLELGLADAAGVTAVTVLAQAVAITPGGLGTYEAVGTAALVALGHPAPEAFAVVLTTHAVKTAYSIVLGGAAVLAPSPGYLGRLRLPARRPERPAADPPSPLAPVVVFIPAYDEEAVIGGVLERIPRRVGGREVQVLVVDDGSRDRTAAIAAAAGATVLSQPRNLGLGAAVRRGLRESAALRPAAGVYLDADDEYRPEDIAAVVAPVLDGTADYVIGSRFRGHIEHMRAHRRVGNLALTRWVRWMTREPGLTDGQSGFRAFSPAALEAGEVIHDYNYAQVLTLDLLAKGFRYTEVPIGYAFRTTGTSFISLGRYLRAVIPAVHRELNDRGPAVPSAPVGQSSTTWERNPSRAVAQR
ncbi:hypothetical protein GCM10022199_04970 [Marihabitans asiaticum]|uniref:Glycosyltransferase involved in cell wall biosynthesis n=1 Tax=Marihabitans asiaticum TaxID=415218 RepID=A0A560WDS9_9MICO|nr:lysylphosphatidylglycerol synthase domain-containing protein [Marihabitans asiaticum]TWD15833.1 glycosyltransferase involved in cell wall biosynthesis [Marihabitans asiaticum]